MLRQLLHTCRLSYEKRQRHAKNAAGRKLLQIISRKQSNLAVAADVATIDEMLSIADQVRLPASQDVIAVLRPALHKLHTDTKACRSPFHLCSSKEPCGGGSESG